jgi:hypothetical protein
MRLHTHPSIPIDPNDPAWPESLNLSYDPSPTPRTAYTFLALHAALCVLWAYFAGTPTRDWLDLPFVTVMGVNACIVNPFVSLATMYAMKVQIDTTRSTKGISVLTQSTMGFQALVFLALAISWPLRFKVPKNLSRGMGWEYWVQEWYPLVGWACVNNAIIGIGLGIVAVCAGSDGEAGGV